MKSFKKIIILLSIPFLSFFELLANEKKLEVFTLIESSEATLKILDKNTDLKDFKNYLSKCRAVLIFPEVYEGCFIIGAKGGNGILLI